MARLPKSIIKKYGISKRAWQVFRGQKRTTTPTRRATNMANRRRASPRRRFSRRRFRRPKTVPVEMVLGAAAIPFTPGYPDGQSPAALAQSGDFQGLMSTLVHGFTGFNIGTGQFNPMAALNPFDFNTARYTKMLIWTGLAGMVRKKLVPKSSVLIKKVPLIGRWVS